MIRPGLAIWLTMIAIASAVLFRISEDVETLQDSLAGLNAQIVAEEEAIRVLRAEWAYLNRPERLRLLADAVTPLEPLRGDQIIANLAAVPMPLPEAGEGLALVAGLPEAFAALPLPARRPPSFASRPRPAPPVVADRGPQIVEQPLAPLSVVPAAAAAASGAPVAPATNPTPPTSAAPVPAAPPLFAPPPDRDEPADRPPPADRAPGAPVMLRVSR